MTTRKNQKQIKPIEQWGATEWKAAHEQKNAAYEELKKELKGILVYLHRAIGRIQENIN
ncbi:unnamed protein product [marine sediment metagenome]|uniref:Uncharacterized protein n=1 Tax=marine sediment metagenome TaxID=412755 RepID=X1S6V5_9ZZZZ